MQANSSTKTKVSSEGNEIPIQRSVMIQRGNILKMPVSDTPPSVLHACLNPENTQYSTSYTGGKTEAQVEVKLGGPPRNGLGKAG